MREAAAAAGLDPEALLARALGDEAGARLHAALAAFEHDGCPGLPTWVVDGERFWGKDRVEWLARRLETGPRGTEDIG